MRASGIAINYKKGLDAQRLLNRWQSKAAPVLYHDLGGFERRRAPLVAQSGSDLVDISQYHFAFYTTVSVPAGDGFQGENGRVVVLCQVFDDVIMVKGNAMAGVYGRGRASDQDGRGYFRLQQRGMRQERFPIRNFCLLVHSATALCGLCGSLRNSEAKARALGSRLPRVWATSVHPTGDTTGLIGVHRLNKFAPGTNSAPGDDVIDRGLGELAAGNLGEMPMRHQRFVEFKWPGFEYEIHGGTQPRYPFQSRVRAAYRPRGPPRSSGRPPLERLVGLASGPWHGAAQR